MLNAYRYHQEKYFVFTFFAFFFGCNKNRTLQSQTFKEKAHLI